jgi:predicted AlkP superfamily pyrophosphatase or phosphodiesterase
MLRGNLNPIFNRRTLLLIGALVAASPALAATGTSLPQPAKPLVMLISIDGMRPDGGFPDAAFLVSFKNGYEVGAAMSGPLVSSPSNLGMHGYVPDRTELRSAFFIVGPHVAAGRSLGEIDMRRIAPTLAGIMGFSLRDADLGGLSLEQP